MGPTGRNALLRLRCWYTGETTWLWDWTGDYEAAEAWIELCADMTGDWILDERAIGGGPTPWEEP